MVDEADPFPAVLQKVVAWLQERELGTKYKYAILTDGYDVSMQHCCRISKGLCHFIELSNDSTFCFTSSLRAWDMSKFLNIQCRTSRIRYPQFAKKWINIRKSYGNFYKVWLLNCFAKLNVPVLQPKNVIIYIEVPNCNARVENYMNGVEHLA